jgi:acyl carrier protein
MSQDEVYKRLKEYLEELFEIAPERVQRDARLFEDLDLDSIDAVDLVVKLQELTGRRIAPKEFKSVRTVGDVVDRVCDLLVA